MYTVPRFKMQVDLKGPALERAAFNSCTCGKPLNSDSKNSMQVLRAAQSSVVPFVGRNGQGHVVGWVRRAGRSRPSWRKKPGKMFA